MACRRFGVCIGAGALKVTSDGGGLGDECNYFVDIKVSGDIGIGRFFAEANRVNCGHTTADARATIDFHIDMADGSAAGVEGDRHCFGVGHEHARAVAGFGPIHEIGAHGAHKAFAHVAGIEERFPAIPEDGVFEGVFPGYHRGLQVTATKHERGGFGVDINIEFGSCGNVAGSFGCPTHDDGFANVLCQIWLE